MTQAIGSGTLSWEMTVVNEGDCHVGSPTGTEEEIIGYVDSSYAFTIGGTDTPLTGGSTYILSPGGLYCPASGPTPASQTLNGPGYSLVVVEGDLGDMTGNQYNAGTIGPLYQVQSIIYAAPGNRSSSGYSNTETDGATTTVGSSFASGTSDTFTAGFSWAGLGSSLSWTWGETTTTGNSGAFTSTIASASGVSLANQSGNPNAINHNQDLFVIWLDPAIEITATGTGSLNYTVGTQLQTSGSPEEVDSVEVTALGMEANTSGVTTVPLSILQQQSVAGETLPGLANICASHTYYPNSCTLANQCGCVPSDFTAILAMDPLLKYLPTTTPLNANTSSASACTNPSSTAECRYVPIMTTNDGSLQQTVALYGPEQAGDSIPTNTYSLTDSTSTTETLSQTFSQSEGFSWKISYAVGGIGPSLSSGSEWTFTNTESIGASDGSSHAASVTLSSSTVGCSAEENVFEDTVFHTFVLQQPSGTSCP